MMTEIQYATVMSVGNICIMKPKDAIPSETEVVGR